MYRSDDLINVPWFEGGGQDGDDPICKLEQEIAQYTKYMELRDYDVTLRNRLIYSLFNLLKTHDRQIKMLVYGSYANGLSNPGSDIDLQLIRGQSKDFSHSFVGGLVEDLKMDPSFSSIDFLSRARVPVIKGIHRNTGIHFDLTFASSQIETQIAAQNIVWIRNQLSINEYILPLYRVIRGILRSREFDIPYKGGASSFLTLLLILSYFRFKNDHCKISDSPNYTPRYSPLLFVEDPMGLEDLSTTSTSDEAYEIAHNSSMDVNGGESPIISDSSLAGECPPHKKSPMVIDNFTPFNGTLVFENTQSLGCTTIKEDTLTENKEESDIISNTSQSDIHSISMPLNDDVDIQNTRAEEELSIVEPEPVEIAVEELYEDGIYHNKMDELRANSPNALNVLGFLEFYGFIFDYDNFALKANEVGGIIPRIPNREILNDGGAFLCCIDPITGRNIGEICFNFKHIRLAFQWCYFVLQKHENELPPKMAKITEIDGTSRTSILRRIIFNEGVIQNIRMNFENETL